MEVKGIIHLIGETEEFGNNGFKKRQLVIATEEQYIQYIPVDFVKDKTSILDKFKVGQTVKVAVNVRGNEYNGKFYINFQGWKIEATDRPGSAVNKYEEPSPEQLAAARQKEDDDFFKNLPPKTLTNAI